MGFEAEIIVYLDNGNNFSIDLTPGMWAVLREYAGLKIELDKNKYTSYVLTDETISKYIKTHPKGYIKPNEMEIEKEINRYQQAIKNLKKLKQEVNNKS